MKPWSSEGDKVLGPKGEVVGTMCNQYVAQMVAALVYDDSNVDLIVAMRNALPAILDTLEAADEMSGFIQGHALCVACAVEDDHAATCPVIKFASARARLDAEDGGEGER